jgi:hypothetical protein
MLKDLFATDKYAPGSSPFDDEEDICCGKHEFCKKKPTPKVFQQPEYYDDEELDIFKNRSSDSYTTDEIEQFAEIFHTLWESDVPGWIISLQSRCIELPNPLKDEILLFLNPISGNIYHS